MKRSPFISSLLLALVATSVSAVTLNKQPSLKVFAAGSMTGAMTAASKLYTEQTGQKFDLTFGPAGVLRERIEKGDAADIYVSANFAHPQTLADHGLAMQPIVLVRNRVCVKALPEFGLTTDNVLDRMLDPNVGIGTSTPKADPGGDYAWLLFEKAEKVRPGAQVVLQAKAQQLVGSGNDKPAPNGQNAMEYAFAQKTVQLSIGYCSSRQTTPDPKYTSVELPPALAITPNYGMSVITRSKKSHDAAYRFALFLMSPQAQQVMAQYGFTPVTIPAPN